MINFSIFDLLVVAVYGLGFIVLFVISVFVVIFSKFKPIVIPAIIIIAIGLWQVGSSAVFAYRWSAWIDSHRSVAKSPAPSPIISLHITCEDNVPFATNEETQVGDCIWESDEKITNLAVTLAHNGGFLETGMDPTMRWTLVNASESCFDSALNIVPVTENLVYNEAFYIRGICFNLIPIDTPSAEYHLSARRDINPLATEAVYSDQTLIHRPSGKIIDHVALGGYRPEFGFFYPIRAILPWGTPDTVYLTDYENSEIRTLFTTIPPFNDIWFRPPPSDDEFSRELYLNDIAPWDDASVLRALQSGDNHFVLAQRVRQVCFEWNSIGPDVRARLEEIFQTHADNPRISELSEVCGISECRLGSYGSLGPETTCETPRSSNQN